MALIKCPECGREVSDQADICVNCGYKIAGTENLHKMAQEKENQMNQERNEKNKVIMASVIAVIVIAIFIWFIWYQSTATERARQRLQDSVNELEQIQNEIDDLQRQKDYNDYLIDQYENNY